jgi:hypothetical protein
MAWVKETIGLYARFAFKSHDLHGVHGIESVTRRCFWRHRREGCSRDTW